MVRSSVRAASTSMFPASTDLRSFSAKALGTGSPSLSDSSRSVRGSARSGARMTSTRFNFRRQRKSWSPLRWRYLFLCLRHRGGCKLLRTENAAYLHVLLVYLHAQCKVVVVIGAHFACLAHHQQYRVSLRQPLSHTAIRLVRLGFDLALGRFSPVIKPLDVYLYFVEE